METISNTVWQRNGSCIIFDQKSLGPFIADGSVISLRQLLSWTKGQPTNPPVSGKTILISGLETIVETMESQKAFEILSHRVRPILLDIRDRWPNFGIVFGFSSHKNAFRETTLEEELVFHRRDNQQIRLSDGLWDGSARNSMKRIVREGEKPGSEMTIGYYVARIS
jgi:hypothetical protein